MTESLLALIPTYGLWLVSGIVALACLGLPLPASILVMTAGGFAASGDLTLWQLLLVVFVCYVAADQISYQIGRRAGPSLISGLKDRPRLAPTVTRAEALLSRNGAWAVLLCKAVLIPLGPYISYVSGAVGLSWLPYTCAALTGAAAWTGAFTLLGYSFGDRISQLSSLITNALGFVVALAVALATAWWLWRSWRAYKSEKL